MLDGKMEDDASLKPVPRHSRTGRTTLVLGPRTRAGVCRGRGRRRKRGLSDGRGGIRGGTYRPRRSVLSCPSSNERALEKAKTLPVDALILDLEDAVAVDARTSRVRTPVLQQHPGLRASGDHHPGQRDRRSGDTDLAAACAAGPDGIVVPKVNTAEEVRRSSSGDGEARCARPHPTVGDDRDADRDLQRAEDRESDRLAARHRDQHLGQGTARRPCAGRAPLLTSLSMALLAGRESASGPRRSTTTSRMPTASGRV